MRRYLQTKLLAGAFAGVLLLGMPLALWSTQWSTQAQAPPAPNVGQKLSVTSFEGVAVSKAPDKNQNRPIRVEQSASVQLDWKATKVNTDGSWAFDITGGTVVIGSETYKVDKGKGFVTASGLVRWHLSGTTANGERITYACSGLVGILNGQAIKAMNGILKEGDEKFNIHFLATIR